MKKVITFGEIMLRLATPERQRFTQTHQLNLSFGGGEANVAVSLSRFGLETEFITRLPKNEWSERCLMELRSHNVGLQHVLFGGNRMGIYFLETGSVARPSQVLYDRDHTSISEIVPQSIDWQAVFANASWFHWTGITPALSANAALVCKEAISAANKLGVPVSVDLNYRNKLWKYGKTAQEVMPDLVSGCDLILGNEVDAETIFGIKPPDFDASTTNGVINPLGFQSVCEQLQTKFPKAKNIVITLRGAISADHNTWAGVLFDGQQMYASRSYHITPIVDRVGGGDAFMAGVIYGMLKNLDKQTVVEFAAAASCLKHTINSDFNLVTVSEVNKLMDGDASGRVVR